MARRHVARRQRVCRNCKVGRMAREVANTGGVPIVPVMSTVAEIESALAKLPVEAQREVAAWLESRLWPETPAMVVAIDEAERSLAEEGGVPVEEVRKNLRSWITE